jgi:endonuclease YncB( thermonuclease family)
MGAAIPFVLLLAALTLFLISTNQWKLWLRGAIWAAGLVLLIATLFLNTSHSGGLMSALGDLASNLMHPGRSHLSEYLKANSSEVGQYVLSLLDLFVILGLVLAVVALIAFTPGEGLERALRPIMIALVGAVLGGALTSLVVGIGLGRPDLRPNYVGLQRADIINGDTIVIGQGPRFLVRLGNMDAPETGQVCWGQHNSRDCGAAAADNLWRIVQTVGLLSCRFERPDLRSEDNLPLAVCSGTGANANLNIAQQMIHDGYAVGADGRPDADAVKEGRGLLVQCTVTPPAWRAMTQRARDAFQRNPRDRSAQTPVMGDCPAAGVTHGPAGPAPNQGRRA